MPIRLSGINSGLDTDAIVQELVSAYSLKKEKYEKEQTKIEWKQESWKTLNTKIYGLYTNVSNLRFDSAYNLKKSSVSDASKARVTAGAGAVTGTQTLNVSKMAQAAYITGAKLGTGEQDITSSTKLSELGYNGADTVLKLRSESDGKETEIKLNADSTIKDVITQLKDAGLNANFDEDNGRIFLSAKESGSAGEFTLTANSASGEAALATLGLSTQAPSDTNYSIPKALYDAVAGAAPITDEEDGEAGTVDVAAFIKDRINEYKKLQKELSAEGITEEKKEELEAEMAGQKNAMDTLGFGYLVEDNTKTPEEIDAEIAILVDKANEAHTISSDIFANEEKAVKINAQDAEIRLNGVTYTSNTNSFSINGLTIEVTGVTDVESETVGADENVVKQIKENPISITTSVDTQGIYDKVKDFLTEYNNVINEITKLYNAESASDYEPLTDEEKDAMSEEQVEKWENKIKSALLRRDSSLSGIMNAMVNTMSQSIKVDDQTLSLSSFGIQTLGFLNAAQNEHYAYHIDGDADDENSSGKEDKLMKAIQDDPDQVCDFMKELSKNLYDAIHEKMQSTELSSAYKVYNDKELDSQLTKYKKLISDWEEKIADQEEYYYNKFSQMEVALSKLQNQTNSLAGLIGQ